VLVEHAGFLGGTWTAGLLGVMLDHENKTGLMQELKQTLTERKWRNTKVWTDELFYVRCRADETAARRTVRRA